MQELRALTAREPDWAIALRKLVDAAKSRRITPDQLILLVDRLHGAPPRPNLSRRAPEKLPSHPRSSATSPTGEGWHPPKMRIPRECKNPGNLRGGDSFRKEGPPIGDETPLILTPRYRSCTRPIANYDSPETFAIIHDRLMRTALFFLLLSAMSCVAAYPGAPASVVAGYIEADGKGSALASQPSLRYLALPFGRTRREGILSRSSNPTTSARWATRTMPRRSPLPTTFWDR